MVFGSVEYNVEDLEFGLGNSSFRTLIGDMLKPPAGGFIGLQVPDDPFPQVPPPNIKELLGGELKEGIRLA